jgi:hypothetical protein
MVVAFDIDGTLETSSGPVSTALLRSIQRGGSYVYLVSPSSARPQGFPILANGTQRRDNLLAVKAMHPDEENFIYVSDNGDQAEAEAAGFEYQWPSAFVEVT